MKSKLLLLATALTIFFPKAHFAQAPGLGAASGFSVFTAVGAFTNTGATTITGDAGTGAGAFTGLVATDVTGQIHVADPASVLASTAVSNAYTSLATLTCDSVIGVLLGNNQILTPKTYCLGAASTLTGDLILDAQGNPDALFIFKIDGAFSMAALSNIVLVNSASWRNIYWQVNGQLDVGAGSVFRGTAIVNGAINLLGQASVYGRVLSKVGAITMLNNVVVLPTLSDYGDLLSSVWPVAVCTISGYQFTANAPSPYDANTNPMVSVWAGAKINTEDATVSGGSVAASNDAFDDGLGFPALPISPGYTYTFTVTVNANTATGVNYRLWFDWNADGDFSNDMDGNGLPATYHGSLVVSSGPVTVPVNIKPPFGASASYKVRLVVTDDDDLEAGMIPDFYRSGTGGAASPSTVIFATNGEIEDYNAPALILPVTFGSITATEKNCNVYLSFNYLAQQNNKAFEVEHSINGTAWNQVAILPNAGNQGDKSYSYVHTNPSAGTNYYRIKQVDSNGNYSYSKTVTVFSNCRGESRIVSFPNPVQAILTVLLPAGTDKSQILITDAAGKLVFSKSSLQSFNALDIKPLATGLYLLQIVNHEKVVYTKRFVKQ